VIKLFKDNFPDALELIGESRLVIDFMENPVGSLVTMRCSHYHHSDKIVLLGDAAHAMVPFYGQGMNAGFEDLSVLSSILSTQPNLTIAFEEYSKKRKADAHAICDLALYNYWEMSSAVTSSWFKFKRMIYGKLHMLMPNVLVPLYSMVAFSNIPYAQAVRRHARQERIINTIIGGFGMTVFGLLGAFLLMMSRRSINGGN
jgi:kynurenine 3-monooxygenase